MPSREEIYDPIEVTSIIKRTDLPDCYKASVQYRNRAGCLVREAGIFVHYDEIAAGGVFINGVVSHETHPNLVEGDIISGNNRSDPFELSTKKYAMET